MSDSSQQPIILAPKDMTPPQALHKLDIQRYTHTLKSINQSMRMHVLQYGMTVNLSDLQLILKLNLNFNKSIFVFNEKFFI